MAGGSVGCDRFGSGNKKQDAPGPALPIASAAVGAWGAGVASTARTVPTGSEKFEFKDPYQGLPPGSEPPLAPAVPEGDEDTEPFGAPESPGSQDGDAGGEGGGGPVGPGRPDGGVPPMKAQPPVLTL